MRFGIREETPCLGWYRTHRPTYREMRQRWGKFFHLLERESRLVRYHRSEQITVSEEEVRRHFTSLSVSWGGQYIALFFVSYTLCVSVTKEIQKRNSFTETVPYTCVRVVNGSRHRSVRSSHTKSDSANARSWGNTFGTSSNIEGPTRRFRECNEERYFSCGNTLIFREDFATVSLQLHTRERDWRFTRVERNGKMWYLPPQCNVKERREEGSSKRMSLRAMSVLVFSEEGKVRVTT